MISTVGAVVAVLTWIACVAGGIFLGIWFTRQVQQRDRVAVFFTIVVWSLVFYKCAADAVLLALDALIWLLS